MQLMDVLATSGNEAAVRSYILHQARKFCKDIKVDKFGNLIIHKKGKKGTTVMLVAHMDEIGLIIKSVSNLGIMRVAPIGGIDPIACINNKVLIPTKNKERIRGIVTTVAMSDGEEMEEIPLMSDLIIDTGLNKKELKKLGVEIGTFLEFEQQSCYLGSKKYIMGKAADDRVGCHILLELIKKCQKYDTDIYFVFTVQEEVGLYGAKTSVYNINPEWALAIDVTSANDIGEDWHEGTQCLGKGPTLTIMDAELIGNPCLNNNIRNLAKKKNVPLQLEVTEAGTTDALDISLSKGGIPTTVLGVPIRNLHSGISIVHTDDVNNAIKILSELLKSPPKICL